MEDKLCVHFTNQRQFKGGFFGLFVRYSILLHLSPLRIQMCHRMHEIEPRTLALTAYLLSNKYIYMYKIKLWDSLIESQTL
jgi:hypothetical protein